MINYFRLVTTILFALVIGVLLWSAFHYYGKTVAQQSEISVATQAKNQAEFITQTQALTVGIFNTLAGANINAKQTMRNDVATQIVAINKAVQGDPCAIQLVPPAAADSLRRQADSLRASSAAATSGQPAK